MLLLGIDFETTGLDLKTARIIEAGLVFCDTKYNRFLDKYNFLIYEPGYPRSEPFAKELHGIEEDMLKLRGISPLNAVTTINDLMTHADYIVGHNCLNFDKLMYEEECKRQGVLPSPRPWIDTKTDIEYPKFMSSKRLGHLAVDHGIMHMNAHSALPDVETMMQILLKYDIGNVIKRANSPIKKLVGYVTPDKKYLPKYRRFMWDPEKVEWYKFVREFEVNQEIKSCNFDVRVEE